MLQRPDLVKKAQNGRTRPFFSEARIAAIFRRLGVLFQSLKTDESLITVTSKFAAAVYDLYIKNNGKVRLTGDRMKMLQLTLPFMLRDFLKPEIDEVNHAITSAPPGHPLHKIPLVADPSNDIISLLIKANEWNLLSRQKDLPIDKLPHLEQLGLELIDSLKSVLPERTGATWGHSELFDAFRGWCFEKLHAIMHIPKNLLLYGYLEVTSAQGPEHCHIELMKKLGDLTNNKEIFACIMKFHARYMLLRDMQRTIDSITNQPESLGLNQTFQPEALESWQRYIKNGWKMKNSNQSLPCELGIRYPVLLAAQDRSKLHMKIKV